MEHAADRSSTAVPDHVFLSAAELRATEAFSSWTEGGGDLAVAGGLVRHFGLDRQRERVGERVERARGGAVYAVGAIFSCSEVSASGGTVLTV
jgi:hypothetical protein